MVNFSTIVAPSATSQPCEIWFRSVFACRRAVRVLAYGRPQSPTELFLGHGHLGLLPGRKNFDCVTFFCGPSAPTMALISDSSVIPGLNVILGFVLGPAFRLLHTKRPRRPPIRRTPKTRRPDRHAHMIELPAPAGCGHDRCSTQAPKSTSTQDNVPSSFRWQVHTFRLETGKHNSRPSSESLRCLGLHDLQPKRFLHGFSHTVRCHLVWKSLIEFSEDELFVALRAHVFYVDRFQCQCGLTIQQSVYPRSESFWEHSTNFLDKKSLTGPSLPHFVLSCSRVTVTTEAFLSRISLSILRHTRALC